MGDILDFDWSDTIAVRQRRPHLDAIQRHLLDTADAKIQALPRRFARAKDKYRELAQLAVLSHWDDCDRFLECNGDRRCEMWRLCCYCAYRKKVKMEARWRDLYTSGRWAHIVISPTNCTEVGMAQEAMSNDVRPQFKYLIALVKKLLRHDLIKGAIARLELEIHFLPLRVRPHLHLLVPEADKKMMEKVLAKAAPSIDCEIVEIADEKYFKNCLYYIQKQAALVAEYQETARRPDFQGKGGFGILNEEVIEAFYLLSHKWEGPMIRYYGTCHSRSKRSLRRELAGDNLDLPVDGWGKESTSRLSRRHVCTPRKSATERAAAKTSGLPRTKEGRTRLTRPG